MDRDALRSLLGRPAPDFREAASEVLGVRRDAAGRVPALADFGDPAPEPSETDRERRLHWQVWCLRDTPFGVTLSGAAYEDNPVHAVNRTFERLTGYSLGAMWGRNPRLLQGPATERKPLGDLHGALRRWEPVTVELWNYRRDGTRFRNRVSLRPAFDDVGTVTHWFGVQGRV
jgi:PAS domain S-box-containing protein